MNPDPVTPATTIPWSQVRGILEQVQVLPKGDWDRVLTALCGEDSELRREVEAYLAYDEGEATLLDGSRPVDAPPERATPSTKRVGPYRLLRLLGRGGMGEVYLAERQEAFEQRVALKLIRTGFDFGEILRRFDNERRILARLEHPNIARILDGGQAEDGRPYFVMEYIDGEPIDIFCSRRQLDLEQRLELFEQVCRAVHVSHHHLVVHRDLKPRNILVTSDHVVKLLDFGIAKLLNTSLMDAYRPTTWLGSRAFSLDYASPEQVHGDATYIASDVYSLGIVLCELLSGGKPFQFAGMNLQEATRVILEETPVRPSDIAGAAGRTKWARRLRGDLDAIVGKALRKEPQERYQSVEQLAGDLRRYLSCQPVDAVKGRVSYLARKFVRRNAWSIATTTLISGIALWALALWQEEGEQRRHLEVAKRNEIRALERALQHAQRGNALLNVTLEFMEERDLLRAEEGGFLANELGVQLNKAGNYDHARILLDRALANEHSIHGGLITLIESNIVNVAILQGDYATAEEKLLGVLEERLGTLGSDHLKVARTRLSLGGLYYEEGRFFEAQQQLEKALAVCELQPDGALQDRVRMLNNLSMVYLAQERGRQALALARESLSLREQIYGTDSSAMATGLKTLGATLLAGGMWEAAEKPLKQALVILRQERHSLDWRLSEAESLYASVLSQQGQFELAEDLLLSNFENLAIARSPESTYTLHAKQRLDAFYELTGREPPPLVSSR